MTSHLSITLNTREAEPGETISGTAYLNLQHPGYSPKLIFSGTEYVRFTYTVSTGSGKSRRTSTRTTEREEETICQEFQLAENLGIGQYSFPFTFTIPTDAPSTFHFQQNRSEGIIKYWMILEINKNEYVEEEIKVSRKSYPEIDNYKEVFSDNKLVSCCCCCACNKGHVSVSATFQKQSYSPGEMVNAVVTIDNTASKWDIMFIKGVAKIVVNLQSHGRSKTVTEECGVFLTKGIKAGQSGTNIPINFELKANPDSPTTVGSILTANYILRIEAPMDGCCDCSYKTPASERPITVQKLKEIYQPKFTPLADNWNPQMMRQQSFSLNMKPQFTPAPLFAKGGVEMTNVNNRNHNYQYPVGNPNSDMINPTTNFGYDEDN